MKTRKSLLALLLCLTMLVGLLPASVLADSIDNGDTAYEEPEENIDVYDGETSSVETTLQEKINEADDGDTITLVGDVDLGSGTVTVDKSVTIDGGGEYSITSTGTAIAMEGTLDVTVKDVTINAKRAIRMGAGEGLNLTVEGCELNVSERGISQEPGSGIITKSKLNVTDTTISFTGVSDYDTEYVNKDNNRGISLYSMMSDSTVNVTDTTVQGFAYDINCSGTTTGLTVNVEGSTLKGRAGLNVWGSNATYSIKNSTIRGINNQSGTSESFACIVFNTGAANNTCDVSGCAFSTYFNEEGAENANAKEYMFAIRANGNSVSVDKDGGNGSSYTVLSGDKGGILETGVTGNTNNSTIAIYGGTYNVDPTDYLAKGATLTKDEDNGTYGVATAYAAEVNGKSYLTLEDAVSAAKDGDTVKLLSNVTVDEQVNVSYEDITIDLGGFSVTNEEGAYGVSVFWVKFKNVTIKNGYINPTAGFGAVDAENFSNVKLENVTITGKGALSSLVIVQPGAEVTIDAKSTVESTANDINYNPAVFVGAADGSASNGATLNVYGKIKADAVRAIQGNGTDKGTANINIYDGAEIKSQKLAMYLPNPCVVNMTGGSVEGYCAIGIKSGTLNISGGTVTGVANDSTISDDNSDSGKINYDGSAILVDSNTSYAGNMQINISGTAKVESKYSTAIREIGNDKSKTNIVGLNVTGGEVIGASGFDAILVRDTTKKNVTISGGTFSSDVSEFVVDGYKAAENTDGTWTVSDTSVAKIGSKGYATLTAAVNAAEAGDTITLTKDVTEDIVIPEGKNITLDLNGFTLTNVESDTVTVEYGATLTVSDTSEAKTGVIDNVTHARAAIYNSGEAILNGGKITRSAETGDKPVSGSKNSYYNIVNHGTMTINEGVTVEQSGNYSSLIENGYYSWNSKNERSGYVEGKNTEWPVMTVNGGSFTGGINTIKNDDNATMNIAGGSFENFTQDAFLNHHIANITGGTFKGTENAAEAVYNCGCDPVHDIGKLTISAGTFEGKVVLKSSGGNESEVAITGGTFKGAVEKANDADASKVEISGGTYSSVPEEFLTDTAKATQNEDGTWSVSDTSVAKIGSKGYASLSAAFAAAEDGDKIVMLKDAAATDTMAVVPAGVSVTLDLAGHTVKARVTSAKKYTIDVKGGIEIVDTVGGGKITYSSSGSSSAYAAVYVEEKASAKLSGIEVDKRMITRGELILDGGDYAASDCLVAYSGAKLTIGKENGEPSETTATISKNTGKSFVTTNGKKVSLTLYSAVVKGSLPDYAVKDVELLAKDAYFDTDSSKQYDIKTETVTYNDKTYYRFVDVTEDDILATVTTPDGAVYKYGGAISSFGSFISDSAEGSTVTLMKDVNIGTNTVTITEAITLDLNGKTLSGAGNGGNPTLTIRGCNATVKNGTIEYTGATEFYAVNVTRNANVTLDSVKISAPNAAEALCVGEPKLTTAYTTTVNIEGTSEIVGRDAGIALLPGENAKSVVNVKNGTVSGGYYGIAGNGSSKGTTEINVSGGTVISTGDDGAGIYHPQNGALTVSGGDISGAVGIQMCAGTLSITGGTVTATQPDSSANKTGDGVIPDGSAVSIVNRAGYANAPTATITGGTFTATKDEAPVKGYGWDASAATPKQEWTEVENNVNISGGTYSEDFDNNLLAQSKTTVEQPNGTFTIGNAKGAVDVKYTLSAVAHESTVQDGQGNSIGKFFNYGDKVTVDITIDTDNEIKQFGSFGFIVNYDSEVFNAPTVEKKANGAIMTRVIEDGKLKVGFTSADESTKTDLKSGAATVVTLTFTVKDSAPTGETNISLSDAEITPSGFDLNRSTPTVNNDTVIISHIKLTFAPSAEADINDKSEKNTVRYVRYNETTPVTGPTGVYTVGNWRLAEDTDTEPLWKDDDGNTYTTASLCQTRFTKDTTLRPIAIRQYDVTFVAGENGTVSGETSIKVDINKAVSTEQLGNVTVTANPGYKFDKWVNANGTGVDPLQNKITADTTYTAVFTDESYDISFTENDAASYTDKTGVTDNKAKHGTDVTFKLSEKPDHRVGKVEYTIGDVKKELTPDADGKYTIPGGEIKAQVTITVTPINTYTITFSAADDANGTVGGKNAFVLDFDTMLSAAQFAEVTTNPNPGYKFIGWTKGGVAVTEAEITGTAYNENITILATFDHASYNLINLDESITKDGVTHGTNYTFTPDVEGKLYTDITYTVNGETKTATRNKDGSYTIPGADIIGDVTLGGEYFVGTLTFILNEDYHALTKSAGDTWSDGTDYAAKIAVLKVDGDSAGEHTYTMHDRTTFYWSQAYGAYVHIVKGWTETGEGVETAATILAGLRRTDTAAEKVSYTGDLNGSDTITPVDAMIINDIIHGTRSVTTSELQRLMCDVNGNQSATTDDINKILNTYVNG